MTVILKIVSLTLWDVGAAAAMASQEEDYGEP